MFFVDLCHAGSRSHHRRPETNRAQKNHAGRQAYKKRDRHSGRRKVLCGEGCFQGLACQHTIVEQKWSYEDFCDVTIRLEDCTYALNRQVEVIALVGELPVVANYFYHEEVKKSAKKF